MFLQSEALDERRLFTYEERSAALKRSNGVCAHCGKKLTTKTMTMDHIIPLSRGGKNEPDNLVALCPECNKEKGRLLLMPRSYYMAVKNPSELLAMELYVEKWFQSVKDQFDIEKFPLIAPVTHMQLSTCEKIRPKKNLYIPSMMLKWQIINADYYAEIDAVTGIDIKEIRRDIPKISIFYKEDESGRIPKVALYSLRKNSSDKILAVVAVHVMLDHKHMDVWIPWSELPRKYNGQILFNVVSLLLDSLTRIAGYSINHYTVRSTLEHTNVLTDFTKNAIRRPFFGIEYKYHSPDTESTNEQLGEVLSITRGIFFKEECIESTEGEFEHLDSAEYLKMVFDS